MGGDACMSVSWSCCSLIMLGVLLLYWPENDFSLV